MSDLPSANTRSNISLCVILPLGGESGMEAVGDLANSCAMVGAANVQRGMRMMGSIMPTVASATTFVREVGITIDLARGERRRRGRREFWLEKKTLKVVSAVRRSRETRLPLFVPKLPGEDSSGCGREA